MTGKRKRTVKATKSKVSALKESSMNLCSKHLFSKPAIKKIRQELLSWYDANQRDLPWRKIAANEVDPNVRGYAVWISEVMLQQTQVATVIPYFNKWIKKWPTIETLASSDLEEVYKVWAGLGYYSRARRLHEGAKYLVTKMDATMPQTVGELSSTIPGIGPYSASAIASVAFQKVVGVVDGNVIRVLSRMREVGADSSRSSVRDHLWSLANELVSDTRPGDFNQALMELGATVCTPQNPKCSECAVRSSCAAYSKIKTDTEIALDSFLKKNSELKSKSCSDVEECHLCLPDHLWKANPQVTVFPVKTPKKRPREERVLVLVLDREDLFLLTRRPEEGLLAGLWEFPKLVLADDGDLDQSRDSLLDELAVGQSSVISRKHVGEVIHIFSHIRTTYVVEHIRVAPSLALGDLERPTSWWSAGQVRTAAVSTAVKKILDAVEKLLKTERLPEKDSKSASNKRKKTSSDPRQSSIKSFFT